MAIFLLIFLLKEKNTELDRPSLRTDMAILGSKI